MSEDLIEVENGEEALEATAELLDVDPEELRERAEAIELVPTESETTAAND
jgi:hypothetical protein